MFNTRQAERHQLLAGDRAGYNVRLALGPAGTVPGDVVGEVTVVGGPAQRPPPPNYGSRAVGLRSFDQTGWEVQARIEFFGNVVFVMGPPADSGGRAGSVE